MEKLSIVNTYISVKEYNGNRVVTLNDVDTVHKRSPGTARRNFNHNKQRFIEGEDYYKIQPNEIRTVGIKSHNGGIVLTESGYLMIVKSFTDDLSWDIQRALVKLYFRNKQTDKQFEQPKAENKEYKYVKTTYNSVTVATVCTISEAFGVTYDSVYQAIKKILIENKDYELLLGGDLAKFKKENHKYQSTASSLYIIYCSGFKKLMKYFSITDEPLIMIEDNKPNQRKGYVADEAVCSLMGHIRREIKGIEALTYLIEGVDTVDNLNLFRDILVKKLKKLNWWEMDAKTVTLNPHKASLVELTSCFNGDRGMRH